MFQSLSITVGDCGCCQICFSSRARQLVVICVIMLLCCATLHSSQTAIVPYCYCWSRYPPRAQSSRLLSSLEHFSCLGQETTWVALFLLQCSCLENPRDGGAWWAAVYGVTQSRTRLKWLSSSSRSCHQAMVFLSDVHCDSEWTCPKSKNFWLGPPLSLPREGQWFVHSLLLVVTPL